MPAQKAKKRAQSTAAFKKQLDLLILEARREAIDEQREMMGCGHPVAALNLPSYLVGHDAVARTMYCRSCSIQGSKEKSNG